MSNKQKFLILSSLLFISGCNDTLTIKDSRLRDRVIACSAGYSDKASGAIKAAYDKTALSGELSLSFKEAARSIIFDELPSEQRLKAYHDYIQCVEGYWNDHTLIKASLNEKHK